MPAAPRLDRLPLELLQQVADYCDEQAVWRLSATSKWVRAGAELALRPFLKAQMIRASPPWVTDIYRHWDRKHAPTTTRPRDTLRPFLLNLANARFESHLYAHPSSASYLRELTVEILDCQPDAGWRYIIRFASQLTHVAIHMLDGQWTIPGPSGFGFGPWPDMFIGHALDRGQHIHGLEMSEIWPLPFRQAEVRFPKLTQLVLATSARVFAHLAQFSTCCSDFTELVLSCHTRIYRGELQNLAGQTYNNLRYLTITGHITIVNGALEAILGNTSSIAYLTIYLSPQHFASPIERILQVGAICVHKALLGLALYGPYAIGVLCSLQTWQLAYLGHPFLSNLAVLVFERPDEYPARFNNTHEYPRIYENKLDLPKLERLVIVDIPIGWEPAPHQPEEVVYNNIFKPCRTFQRALRVTSYPKDPFAEDLESTRKIVLVDDDDPMY